MTGSCLNDWLLSKHVAKLEPISLLQEEARPRQVSSNATRQEEEIFPCLFLDPMPETTVVTLAS